MFKFLSKSRRSKSSDRRFRPILECLEDRVVPAVDMLSGVTGINNTGWYPPDTGVAAGTNYVVETVNERMAIYNKSSGALVSSENLSSLFTGLYGSGTGEGYFDPQVMYDDIANRFVIAAPTTSSTSSGPYTAYIDFAVSNSSDPTQGWTTRQIEVDQGGKVWVDNGKLGYNADGWVYSGNNYGSLGGAMVLSIDKSSVGNATWTSYLTNVSGFSTVPARMHGAVSGGPEYLVEDNGGSVTVLTMTNVLSSSPTFANTSLSVNESSGGAFTQPGGTISFDGRVLSVEWNNNNLVAAWNSSVGSDGSAAWVEINTSSKPVLAQQGNIHPGTGISTFMPAIAVDAAGDIGVTFIEGSSSQYPSTYITGRLGTDPLNTMEGSVLVQAGNASVTGSRIGDYAGVSLDPSSSNTFWAANEYGLSGVAGNWGTAIAQFQMASNSNVAPPTITTAASASPNPVTGTTTNLSVAASDSSGGTDLTYTWSVLSEPSGVTSPAFSVNGSNNANNSTATFYAAGSYTFQVAVSNAGGTVTSDVTVTVNQTLTKITVSPSSVSLADGTSQQFTATAVDQFGKAMASQPTFTWTLSGSGTLSGTGLYTAPSSGSGTATVSAACSGKTGSATVSYGSVPSAPTNLTATTANATSINLSWTSPGNETGFIIQESTNGGKSWTTVASPTSSAATGSTVTYTVNGLKKKSTYEFRVAATNPYGQSAWSNTTTGTQGTPSDGDAPVAHVPGKSYLADSSAANLLVNSTDFSAAGYLVSRQNAKKK